MKNQNLNVGDKLLCKKNLNELYASFNKNKYYIVYDIKLFDNNTDYCYYIEFDKKKYYSFRYSVRFFYEHFYTKQEERKIKLEKLYEETGY